MGYELYGATTKECRKLERMDKEIDRLSKAIDHKSHEYVELEYRLCVKYFGKSPKNDESEYITNWRKNLQFLIYQHDLKAGKIKKSFEMERFSREWSEHLKTTADETLDLMGKIINGEIAFEDTLKK